MTQAQAPKSAVFVVGAGASKEAGLPVGSELKELIGAALNIRYDYFRGLVSGDAQIAQALRVMARNATPPQQNIDALQRECWAIHNAMPLALSIDHFLDINSSNAELVTCGKLAIARLILQSEANSRLVVADLEAFEGFSFPGMQDTWYSKFFRLFRLWCGSIHCFGVRPAG